MSIVSSSLCFHTNFLADTSCILLTPIQQNVTRVNMQQGSGMAFAEWTSEGLNGGWYGHVFVADFIGNNTNNKLRVKELSNIRRETGDPYMVGYAGFEDDKLTKVALANLRLWNGTSNSAEASRPSTRLKLYLTGVQDGTVATIRHLTGPNGSASSNITWSGLDWPLSKNGSETTVKNDTIITKIQGGQLEVLVNATQAILVTW